MAQNGAAQALMASGAERFVQRIDQRCRNRVVVLAIDPVILQEPKVQIERTARAARLSRKDHGREA